MSKKKPTKKGSSVYLTSNEVPKTEIPDPNVMPDITGHGGAPTKYRPEFNQMLINHMASGLSFESFAAITKCSVSIMHEWVKDNALFKDAKVEAFAQCRLFWEKLGVYYIVEGRQIEIEGPDGKKIKTKGTEKLNANLYRLNMVNRFGWKNSGSEESDGAGVTINLHSAIMHAIKTKREKAK